MLHSHLPIQTEEGTVRGSETSITLSRGDSLDIETTSLAVLCWLYDDTHFAPLTEKAIHWLLGRSKDGMFCSTQATVLALKVNNDTSRPLAQDTPRQYQYSV